MLSSGLSQSARHDSVLLTILHFISTKIIFDDKYRYSPFFSCKESTISYVPDNALAPKGSLVPSPPCVLGPTISLFVPAQRLVSILTGITFNSAFVYVFLILLYILSLGLQRYRKRRLPSPKHRLKNTKHHFLVVISSIIIIDSACDESDKFVTDGVSHEVAYVHHRSVILPAEPSLCDAFLFSPDVP